MKIPDRWAHILLGIGGLIIICLSYPSPSQAHERVGDITKEEFDSSRTALIRQFPSAFQTTSSILDQLIRLAQFDLPINYYQSYVDNLNALALTGIQNIAKTHLDGSRLVILIVGDISVIKPGLEELKMEIHELDIEGSYI